MFDVTQPTPLDLRWRMFGIPIRVHPLFWLVAILLGPMDPREGILWVVAVFVSILVHELGHALSARAFGWWPSILLYSFGGLTFYEPRFQTVGQRIVVLVCGPLAGFLLAGLILGGVYLGGWPSHEMLGSLLEYFLVINIAWGVMNLLPVFPLDGGQISRTVLTWLNPRRGGLWASYLSIAVAAAVVVAALIWLRSVYIAILFGLLAFQEISRLAYERRGRWDS
jgi:membrane-associated protease RseP (regulator of RpoE activity)